MNFNCLTNDPICGTNYFCTPCVEAIRSRSAAWKAAAKRYRALSDPKLTELALEDEETPSGPRSTATCTKAQTIATPPTLASLVVSHCHDDDCPACISFLHK